MTAPLTFLKITLLFLACSLIIACHSDGNKKRTIPDINTFNIYTFENAIYSYNEDTGISTKRGEFDSGENQFIELNTDEDKQGYEYAVYVSNNIVYLLNYDKESNAKKIKLAEIDENQVICGLIPKTTATKQSYLDDTISNRSTLHLPVLTIEYQGSGLSCDPNTNLRDTLNFSSVIKTPSNTKDIVKSSGKSEHVLGGLVVDYNSINSAGQIDQGGSTGFLGQDLSGNKIAFNYTTDEIEDQWSATFMPSTGAQFIKQVSNNQVLVQSDEQLYVLNTETLFTVNKGGSNPTPIQEKIDSMFNEEVLNLDSSEPISTNDQTNSDTFVVKHNNKLYIYDSEKLTQIPSNETLASQNADKIAFDLMKDDTTLVIQEDIGVQTLIAISSKTLESTTILSASKIEFYIIDNQFYVNTLELEAGAGWQAHWFKRLNSSYTFKTYDNSRFLYTKNLQKQRSDIYLLSSNDGISVEEMIKPALYKFDSSERNGRKKGKDGDNKTVDFSFGQLNTNVSGIQESIIVNDKYGKITLIGINEDSGVGRSVKEQYYFDPSQKKANPEIDEQSLTLMSRKML